MVEDCLWNLHPDGGSEWFWSLDEEPDRSVKDEKVDEKREGGKKENGVSDFR